MNMIPTKIFQPKSFDGDGFFLEMMMPESRNPATMPNRVSGPEIIVASAVKKRIT
jgi:hypothetical protein